jgi:hypothetical protein
MPDVQPAHRMKLASSTNMGARLPSSSLSLSTYRSPLATASRWLLADASSKSVATRVCGWH